MVTYEHNGKNAKIWRHSAGRFTATLVMVVGALCTDYMTAEETTIATMDAIAVLVVATDFFGLLFGNFAVDEPEHYRRKKMGSEWTPAAALTPRDHFFKRTRKKIPSILNAVLCFCIAVGTFHMGAVLLGAAVTTSVSATFHYSLLMSTLTVVPACFVWGGDRNTWLRLVLGSGCETDWEIHLMHTGLATISGSWFGAFAIPLDWDRPWQVWPISCVYGALVGHLLVNGHVLLGSGFRAPSTVRKRKYV